VFRVSLNGIPQDRRTEWLGDADIMGGLSDCSIKLHDSEDQRTLPVGLASVPRAHASALVSRRGSPNIAG